MPLNQNEAMTVFMRKVETFLELADGLRLGAQLLQAIGQRNAQLEQYIQHNNLPVPPPPGSPEMPSNVTPIPRPAPQA